MVNALAVVDYIFSLLAAVFQLITSDLILATFFMLTVLGFIAGLMGAVKGKD